MSNVRRLASAGTILLLCAAAAVAKPNFTGEWKLNPEKSDFGMMPAPTSATANVTHEEPSLKVTMKTVSDRGDFTSNNTYTTDGKECVNQGRMGELKSALKWDGDTLVIESKAEFGGNPVTITDRWSLSADGKTLTISRHFASSQGEGDAKQIFEKQ